MKIELDDNCNHIFASDHSYDCNYSYLVCCYCKFRISAKNFVELETKTSNYLFKLLGINLIKGI